MQNGRHRFRGGPKASDWHKSKIPKALKLTPTVPARNNLSMPRGLSLGSNPVPVPYEIYPAGYGV